MGFETQKFLLSVKLINWAQDYRWNAHGVWDVWMDKEEIISKGYY